MPPGVSRPVVGSEQAGLARNSPRDAAVVVCKILPPNAPQQPNWPVAQMAALGCGDPLLNGYVGRDSPSLNVRFHARQNIRPTA